MLSDDEVERQLKREFWSALFQGIRDGIKFLCGLASLYMLFGLIYYYDGQSVTIVFTIVFGFLAAALLL